MAAADLTAQDWAARLVIYRYLIEHTRAPGVEDLAAHAGQGVDEARATLARLNEGRLIFLRPGTDEILMANPFSGVETPFRARIGEKTYSANCAWDTLGIAAAMGQDVAVEAPNAATGETIRYGVVGGELDADADLLVHFALPFRDWYDDLIHT